MVHNHSKSRKWEKERRQKRRFEIGKRRSNKECSNRCIPLASNIRCMHCTHYVSIRCIFAECKEEGKCELSWFVSSMDFKIEPDKRVNLLNRIYRCIDIFCSHYAHCEIVWLCMCLLERAKCSELQSCSLINCGLMNGDVVCSGLG